MLKKRIYLAGSVYNDIPGKNWKKLFVENLGHPERYQFFDPNPVKELNNEHTGLVNFDVVSMDKRAIKKSDIVVAYINKITFGTTMEIHYAYSLQDVTIYVINPSNLYSRDIWLRYHTSMFFNDVKTCANQINMIYENVITNGEYQYED
jgi:nucleoside 2-deoxyribosyltransferase